MRPRNVGAAVFTDVHQVDERLDQLKILWIAVPELRHLRRIVGRNVQFAAYSTVGLSTFRPTTLSRSSDTGTTSRP